MAKIVIAGEADCPYYARAELLGDKLSINLPDFKLHKIVKTPNEWKNWLSETCQTRGWKHEKSPLVWRELIDRGGKGVLIGGANEFQEYAKGYYGVESQMISDDMKKVAGENLQCKEEVDKEDAAYRALSKPVHVCITSAASATCYGILDALCRGDSFGSNTEMIIHLLDSSDKNEYLNGLKMEVQDMSYGLNRGVIVDNDPKVAFKNANYIVLLDGISQGDQNKDDYIKANHKRFVNYAKIIDDVACKSVKVLLAGDGPLNFNAYMMIKNAPNIPRQNIVAMSRMVENQSKSVIAERLNVNTAGVVDLIIWGNPNGEHFIDVSKSRVHGYDGAITGPDSFSLPVPEMVFDKKWLDTEFLELVKTKRSRAEEAMRHPTALSIASAVNSTLQHWCNGSPSGQMFSLGVHSEGWYGVPKDLVFSYPVTFHPKGYWNVVQDIDLSEEVKAKVLETVKDLEDEIDVIFPRPKPPPSETVDANSNNNEANDDAAADKSAEGADQRLETIHEEKKENSEEDINTATDSDKTGTESAADKSGEGTGEPTGDAATGKPTGETTTGEPTGETTTGEPTGEATQQGEATEEG